MPGCELSPDAQKWVLLILAWIGYGTLAGLLARLILPGREPVSAAGTVAVGILGSLVGPLLLSHFLSAERFNPISPFGFLAAVAAAFGLLVGYRSLLTAAGAAQARLQAAEEEDEEEDDQDD